MTTSVPRLAALALALGCATTEPRPAATPAGSAPPSLAATQAVYDPNEEETVVPAVEHVARNVEKERPPPSRHSRQRVITEKEYGQLAARFVLGFKPAACQGLCREDASVTPEGRWTWVLRCKLSRGMKDEPVVACREDAVPPAEAERIVGK